MNDVVGVVHEILKPHAAEAGVEMKVQPWQSMLAVRADPASAAAQQHRQSLPPLFTEKDEVFMTSTVIPPRHDPA